MKQAQLWNALEEQLQTEGILPHAMKRYQTLFYEQEFQKLIKNRAHLPSQVPSAQQKLTALTEQELIQLIEQNPEDISRESIDAISLAQFSKLSQPVLEKIAARFEETYSENLNNCIWYVLTQIVQTGFPHRQIKGPQHYTRKNGNLVITLSAPDEIGLPTGIAARMLFIHICTEVIRKKTRTIEFGKSLRSFMLNTLGIPSTSGPRGSIKAYEQTMISLLATSFTFHSKQAGQGRVGFVLENVRLASRSQLWWETGFNGINGVIEISEEFFEAVTRHSSPVNKNAILDLAATKSPMAIDIYCWLSYRYWKMTKELRGMLPIKWEDLYEQFGSGYKNLKDFVTNFRSALSMVAKVYPEARFIDNHSRYFWLIKSIPHISQPKALSES